MLLKAPEVTFCCDINQKAKRFKTSTSTKRVCSHSGTTAIERNSRANDVHLKHIIVRVQLSCPAEHMHC